MIFIFLKKLLICQTFDLNEIRSFFRLDIIIEKNIFNFEIHDEKFAYNQLF